LGPLDSNPDPLPDRDFYWAEPEATDDARELSPKRPGAEARLGRRAATDCIGGRKGST